MNKFAKYNFTNEVAFQNIALIFYRFLIVKIMS